MDEWGINEMFGEMYACMCHCVYVWMGKMEWVDEWMKGVVDRCFRGWKVVWVDGWMDSWMTWMEWLMCVIE